jgi:hypothetical protein
MSSCFGKVFWGLLLVVLNLKIEGIDLLPDFIGYILVAVGCRGLENASPCFSKACLLSGVLAVLSLIGFILVDGAAIAYGIVVLVVDSAMMWFLLGGVMELAEARVRMDLFVRASNRRNAYVVMMSLYTISWFIVHSWGSEAAGGMAIALIFCILPLMVMILHLIHKVRYEISDGQVSHDFLGQ